MKTKPPTSIDTHIRVDCRPVTDAAGGYLGEEPIYDEPSVSFDIKINALPRPLSTELLALIRKIQKADQTGAYSYTEQYAHR